MFLKLQNMLTLKPHLIDIRSKQLEISQQQQLEGLTVDDNHHLMNRQHVPLGQRMAILMKHYLASQTVWLSSTTFQVKPSIKDHRMWSKLSMSIFMKLLRVNPDVLAMESSMSGDEGWPHIVVRYTAARPVASSLGGTLRQPFFFFYKALRHMCLQLCECTNNEQKRTSHCQQKQDERHSSNDVCLSGASAFFLSFFFFL